MESVIKWQTGHPKKEGKYIITLVEGTVRIDELYPYVYVENSQKTIKYAWRYNFQDAVIAWCPLSDIKPYNKQ